MHIHTLMLNVPYSNRVFCEGCDEVFRLATYPEAVFVHANMHVYDGGPMIWENNVVVVPLNFSLTKEMHNAKQA